MEENINDIIKKDMENKINIAELLKNCPKGTELYSPLCGECTLYDVNDYNIRISTPNKDTLICLYHDGRYCANGEIMLFPKGKTTWEGFQRSFEDGDIVTCNNGACTYTAIFKEMKNNNTFYRHAVTYDDEFCCVSNDWSDFNETCRIATEEEKQKLFDAIKANGYKWNEKTKTLKKVFELKFKVGDKIKKVNGYISGIITNIADDGSYKVEYQGGGISYVHPAYQYEWELVPDIEPKFKVGDKVKSKMSKNIFTVIDIRDGVYILSHTDDKFGYHVPFCLEKDYELIPNKFDITTLKPFNKVLIRDRDTDEWNCHFFSYYRKNSDTPYVCIGWDGINEYKQCIPYGENKHLLGTNNNCDEYYKTW